MKTCNPRIENALQQQGERTPLSLKMAPGPEIKWHDACRPQVEREAPP